MKYHHAKNTVLLGISGVFLLMGSLILFYVFTPLPDTEAIDNVSSKQSIILTDRNGKFLFDFSQNEKRTRIPIEEISPNIINATLAIEDHRFFEHKGVRLDAFIRAMINNIRTRSFSQGGSTITQQVVKNVFFTNEKKIERKMKEFFLAIKIENKLEKNEILELYLNTIPYGGVLFGISEASNTFFGKKTKDVTIAEAAYLAAIPNAPTYFSPYGSNKRDLEKRKNHILNLMRENNFITREEYKKAVQEPVHFQKPDTFSIQAPHFVFFAKESLEKEYGTRLKALEGKRVRTTIDLELQNEIEKLIETFAEKLEKKHKARNVASVVLAVKTGEILAMVGSRDFFNTEINGSVNIITSLRQPGSTFKPIAYAKAFEKGLRPETVVYDVPTQFTVSCDEDKFENTRSGCYSPVNYTGKFTGPITLREALAQSINIPAIKTLYIAGIAEVINLAKDMGITSLTKNQHHYGLSLVLGGAEVTPLELAQAYSVFPNDGILTHYTWRMDEEEPRTKRVLSREVARDITDILSDNSARAPIFGENSPLNITVPPVAAKTGTTNNSQDIWVIGYSPDIVVLVWGGNADSTLLENNASGFSLSPLFKDIMLTASERYRQKNTYFSRNTAPLTINGPDILSGIIDIKNPHTILHYIQKENPTKEQRNLEDEQQYSHWEFSVQEWFKENEEEIKNRENDRTVRKFSITAPKKQKTLRITEPVTITVTDLKIKNTRYEFYVNEKLIGSSHIPVFSFDPEQTIKRNREEVTIQVVANTSNGTFVAEETYRIR